MIDQNNALGMDQEQYRANLLIQADKQLNRTKAALMSRPNTAFFTSLVFSFKHKWDWDVANFQTNGIEIRHSPMFFLSSTPDGRLYNLIHPTLHIAYAHPLRRGPRWAKPWNDACDHLINLQLKARGFVIPDGALCDDQYANLAAEHIYQEILAKHGQEGEPNPYRDLLEPPQDADLGEAQQKVDEALIRAQIRSRQEGDAAGTIPGNIELVLEGLLDPKLPWERVLAKYVHETAGKSDYSWTKPSRRYLSQGLWMPSLVGKGIEHLAAFLDISSSVTDHDFTVQVSEIANIFRMLNPKEITLGLFNSGIVKTVKVRSIKELLGTQFYGRGGTQIAPVIQWANEHKPNLMLVLSDGDFRWPNLTSKVPFIWVVYDRSHFKAPFGRTVHYDIQLKEAE
jgi:predicted metal-dependent peptidase